MSLRFGILIIGYKNKDGITRLLKSLDNVMFYGDREITLIISIDYSGNDTIEQIAKSYEWKHGDKILKIHNTNLGLRKHILLCGDYLEEYKLDAMAVLEDDIFVSPEMYHYMKETVEYYKDNPRIAGISLYKHEVNIFAKQPFYDLSCGDDVFFIQYAMSWGQVWLRDKWKNFKTWYENKGWVKIDNSKIPSNILKWKNSWLKYHIMYCIDNDLYFVYPRVSLSTNFSDPGAHNQLSNTTMQVPICFNHPYKWRLVDIKDSHAVYDAFFENVSLKDYLGYDSIEIDLYGVKPLDTDAKYILSRRRLNAKIIKSWGLFLRPIEANVFYDQPGNDLFLYSINDTSLVSLKNKNRLKYYEYDLKGFNVARLDTFHYLFVFTLQYIKLKFNKIRKIMKSR